MPRTNISMSHPKWGSVEVKTNEPMNETCEFALKGIMALQILVINGAATDDPRLNNVIDILIQCSNDITKLYEAVNESDEESFKQHFNKF